MSKEGEENHNYCVYKHTVVPTGKVYIGMTGINVEKRWKNGYGYTKSQYFAKAIAKYGWENIEHEVLFDGLTFEESCQKEKEMIAYYDSTNHAKGYNIASGGNGTYGVKPSPESLRKSSESHINGKQPQAIPVVCLETGIVYRSKAEASRQTGFTRDAISCNLTGKSTQCHGLHFDYADEKDRKPKIQHISKKEAVKIASDAALKVNCKPVAQLDTDGNIITVYDSVRNAGRVLGIMSGHISECCRNIRKRAGGFMWQFYNEATTGV